MAFAESDGAKIYYEECGEGPALLFAHELTDTLQAWKEQVDYFAPKFRCITFNARGFPPSTLPVNASDYGHVQSANDVAAILKHLDIPSAHMVGTSMGAYTIMTLGLMRPELVLSLVLTSGASGSRPLQEPVPPVTRSMLVAEKMKAGMRGFAEETGEERYRLKEKNPAARRAFIERCACLSQEGARQTVLHYQVKRPSVFTLGDKLARMDFPVLLIVGDDDDACIEPNIFLKRTIPNAGLVVVPKTGHSINVEEPDLFNRTVENFLEAVQAKRWTVRKG